MRIAAFFILQILLVSSLRAADVPVAAAQTWQEGTGDATVYLTLDERRCCMQLPTGAVISSFRLVREGGKVALYLAGKPSGSRIELGATTLALIDPTGKRTELTRCATPPEAIGWMPYVLPEPEPDAAKRHEVAVEIRRRFDEEQRLRNEWIRLSGGRMDAATLAKPEVAAAVEKTTATDEDNRRWLEGTLRAHGWIGRLSHGDPAHEALVLISLHNIQYLRLAATIRACFEAELKRGEISEMAFAGVADRFALVTGDPLAYGIQGQSGADGKPVIPVIADTAKLNANRARIGQPSLAQSAQMMGASILRIDEDGRLAPAEEAAAGSGLDGLDLARAMREPAWGLTEAERLDPALAAAVTAASAADQSALKEWTAKASQWHRTILARLALALAGTAKDSEEATVARRPLFEGLLAGIPAGEEAMRFQLGNTLAYGLVARVAAPTADELARAVALADELAQFIQRPEVARSPMGHAVADTVACVRFRQGDLAGAAAQWKRAIELAGKDVPEVYRRRLAACDAQVAGELPR